MTKIEVIDRYSKIKNTNTNLDFLEEPRNGHLKNFFYTKLSSKEQNDMIGISNDNFIKTLNKLYTNDIRKQKIENINGGFISRTLNRIFGIFKY